MGSEGIQELRSSATALHQRLEESASLLTMFWRAALPSAPSPVLVGQVVRSQHPLPVLPPTSLLPPRPAEPEGQEPNGQLGRRGLEGCVPGGRPPLRGDHALCRSENIPLPPA